MVGRIGLGSISCCLSCDVFSPSAVHRSYGCGIVASDLQSCDDCRSCIVCGFSILGTVSFGSVHHCCRVGLYTPHRPVGCIDDIYRVGNFSCPLYLGFGTQGSSRWQLVTLNGEPWDPGIQFFGTLIPLVRFHHLGFEMMHVGLHRLRSRIAFSRRVWDPGI